MNDKELFLFLPILEALSWVSDVRTHLKKIVNHDDNVLDFQKAFEIYG